MSKTSASFQCLTVALLSLIYIGETSSSDLNKTLSFSLTSRKNQTGHLVTQLSLDKSLKKHVDQWKLNIDHSITEYEGIQTVYIRGIFAVPPKLPGDYELFPGVGYYKFHAWFANGFEEASSICTKEGGHLVIVNSESEHQVMQTLFARHPKHKLNADWAFVGFHDRFREGEYVTIFGQFLNSTGFTRWASPKGPDNWKGIENCGSVHRNGGLNDIECDSKRPFVCEYDLSWSEY